MKRQFLYFVFVNSLTFVNVASVLIDCMEDSSVCSGRGTWGGIWGGALQRRSVWLWALLRSPAGHRVRLSLENVLKPPCCVGAVDLLKRLNLCRYWCTIWYLAGVNAFRFLNFTQWMSTLLECFCTAALRPQEGRQRLYWGLDLCLIS